MSDNQTTAVRRRMLVRGQVQGVGFRPYVYRLAVEMGLSGFVRNDGSGATIEVQGDAELLDRFAARMRDELPPLARIDHLEIGDCPPAGGDAGFQIRFSDAGDPSATEADVTPDTATCDECLGELRAPADRRHGYPFINCTNCGPRYSIVCDVPYDRPLTTMAEFTMCPDCQGEYDAPADRRFHAQPNACPACGPSVFLLSPKGTRVEADDPIAHAAAELLAGRVVAIRGVGGFHLAVRADCEQAVRRLRARKSREHKPLAVMVAHAGDAEILAHLCDAARAVMASPQRPIVIARRRNDAPIAPGVAEGTDTLGVMLPYTPLHHLLFDKLAELANGCEGTGDAPNDSLNLRARLSPAGQPVAEGERFGRDARNDAPAGHRCRAEDSPARSTAAPDCCVVPLVMTSGNISEEPIIADTVEAVERLGDVADLFLSHDREIHRRVDDSVVQVVGANVVPLRRARGWVPLGIDLPTPAGEHGLAVGGELKNTVAMVRRRGDAAQAVLSEHVGDLKDGRVYRHFERVIEHLAQITHTTPAWIAHDLHPMYLSTSWARRQGLRLIGVQHHHAHIAACLADNGRTEPVIGIAADGVGYGPDGTVWGGEILLADLVDYRRLARVRPIGLPGGDAAATRTARPAMGWLFDATGGDIPARWAERLIADPTERDIVGRQLSEKLNTPMSSAMGRYFDAAAAILGLADANHFEAQAPMALEAFVAPCCEDMLPWELADGEGGLAEIDLRPAAIALMESVEAGKDTRRLAAAFHNTIATALAAAAARSAEASGVRVVALSGGCFANRYLSMRMAEFVLMDYGMELLAHRQVPANDGGLALGQAAVGAARAAGMKTKIRAQGSGIRD